MTMAGSAGFLNMLPIYLDHILYPLLTVLLLLLLLLLLLSFITPQEKHKNMKYVRRQNIHIAYRQA